MTALNRITKELILRPRALVDPLVILYQEYQHLFNNWDECKLKFSWSSTSIPRTRVLFAKLTFFPVITSCFKFWKSTGLCLTGLITEHSVLSFSQFTINFQREHQFEMWLQNSWAILLQTIGSGWKIKTLPSSAYLNCSHYYVLYTNLRYLF